MPCQYQQPMGIFSRFFSSTFVAVSIDYRLISVMAADDDGDDDVAHENVVVVTNCKMEMRRFVVLT